MARPDRSARTNSDDFPRRYARTQHFTLGAPRTVEVAADGSRVVFVRSRGPEDPHGCLWVYDVAADEERLVADPLNLLGGAGEEDLPPEERARRERSRESASGVVDYGIDRNARVAVFALSGRLFRCDLTAGETVELAAAGPVLDPRPDPTGLRVAYVTGGALHVIDGDGTDRAVAGEDTRDVTWGLAEFVAAEEMSRDRGYWWSPDGERLLAARVDESPVATIHIADPLHPERPPETRRYPFAGTDNADVSLHIVELDGRRTEVRLPADDPYLVTVTWPEGSPPLAVTQSRNQRRVTVLEIDPDTGATSVLRTDEDPLWVEIVTGVPDRLADGRLVWAADVDGWRRLIVGDEPVTPPGVQLRRVAATTGDQVWFTASTDPVEVHVWRWRAGRAEQMTEAAGVHDVTAGGDVAVVATATMTDPGVRRQVHVRDEPRHLLDSLAAPYPWLPDVRLLTVGERDLRVGVLLPRDHRPGTPLPVLMDPYGGPHLQLVVANAVWWLESQWLADQGFGIVVADGRGTPGRGSGWEREVAGDLATPVLEDQVESLHGAAAAVPDLDLDRVAIRGWSFGGFLAALAVLRRPDVFHAAVAGAPATDQRLYDTHYTERYLGRPDTDPENYRRSSLIDDAHQLSRPLLIIHGLVDDNVLVAHTLRLSQRLLEAGRPHAVIPVSGATHVPRDVVAENLLRLQVEFLRGALGKR